MQLTFELGGDVTLVKIIGNNILFSNSSTNFQQFAPIWGLRLSKVGILKEHPDLENLSDGEMRQETIKRFKEHINKLKSESKIKNYIVEELGKYGWKLKATQREGFRTRKEG